MDSVYDWQEGYDAEWKEIDSDEYRNMMMKREYDRKKKNQKRPINIRLGMMRFILLFIDMSQAMKIIDLKPTRLTLTVKGAKEFVESYFDQNPISQLGVCTIRDGIVSKITDIGGNPKTHIDALNRLSEDECTGDMSLQNILMCSESKLKHIPDYASREIIIITAALSTIDQGNIHDMITIVQKENIRCSVISLAAEVYIFKKLARVTQGKHQVLLDEHDMRFCLQNLVHPPPSFVENKATLIHMGFPNYKKFDNLFKICSCHKKFCKDDSASYICPRCNAAYCDLPVECNICGLILVFAPHLARSYHHLFPLDVFEEVSMSNLPNCKRCSACNRKFDKEKIYLCKGCNSGFCVECDEFLHSSVHVCPNCSEKQIRTQDSLMTE